MGRALFILLLMTWTLVFAGRLVNLLGHEVTPLDWVLLAVAVCGFVATLALWARSRDKRDR